jgi:hypothetical protein
MYKRVIFIVLIISSFIGTLFSQESAPDVNKERFERVVSYINCKYAAYSVERAGKDALKKSFQKSCQCDIKTGQTDKALVQFFKANSMSPNMRLFGQLDSLKLQYSPALTNDGQASVITQFFGSNDLTWFANNKKDYPVFTQNLAEEIRNYFTNNTTTQDSAIAALEQPAVTDLNSNVIVGEVQDTPKSEWMTFFSYLISLLLGIMVGALMYKWWSEKKSKPITNNNNEQERIRGLEQQVTNLQQELADAHQQITKFKKQIAEMTDKNTSTAHIEQELPPPPPPVLREFFMRIPTREGQFNDLRKSDIFRATESVYRFVLNNNNTAKFSIIQDDETMLRAIQGFNVYLEPACEPQGNLDANATRIQTIREGIATKEGDIWRVSQKAIVTFS